MNFSESVVNAILCSIKVSFGVIEAEESS